ncbi:MAG: rod shape-determining protein MreC [Ruminococcaceae bacterium]|nr:rod shape-determining protein MreC [Oscillospiraceae bacterium]
MIFRNKKYMIVLGILILSIVVVYFSALDRENTLAYDNAVGYIVEPVAKLFNSVAVGTSDFFTYFKDKKDLVNENQKLDNKLMELEHNNSKLKSLEIENERLRSLLKFKEQNPEHKLSACTVISKDTSNYYSTFLLDKGTNDGIEKNMPVVGAKGVIGYVVEAGAGFSKVQTVIEGGSSVGCVVTRTGNTAVCEGNTALLKDGLMTMIYVSKEMNLVEGDIVETSGLGEIYPAGLVIGRVKEIKTQPITKTQYAIIQPIENFDFIREVFVITNYQKIR